MTSPPRDDADRFRYGIYLRPDARTCHAVSTVAAQLRAQFGLVSAGAFPPHATLVGSQAFESDEATVSAALTGLLRDRPAFPVHNSGIRPQGVGFVYDLHLTEDGRVNAEIERLAADIDAAVAPYRRATGSPRSNDYRRGEFRAHLSLASHDLLTRTDLHDEVGEYIRDLDVPFPRDFTAHRIVLVRTACDDWSGPWWETMRWEHVHTWTLADRSV